MTFHSQEQASDLKSGVQMSWISDLFPFLVTVGSGVCETLFLLCYGTQLNQT